MWGEHGIKEGCIHYTVHGFSQGDLGKLVQESNYIVRWMERVSSSVT